MSPESGHRFRANDMRKNQSAVRESASTRRSNTWSRTLRFKQECLPKDVRGKNSAPARRVMMKLRLLK
jgi:hypothetical protein